MATLNITINSSEAEQRLSRLESLANSAASAGERTRTSFAGIGSGSASEAITRINAAMDSAGRATDAAASSTKLFDKAVKESKIYTQEYQQAINLLGSEYGKADEQVKRWLPTLKQAEEAIRKQSMSLVSADDAGKSFYETTDRVSVMTDKLSKNIKYTADGYETLKTKTTSATSTTALLEKAFADSGNRTEAYQNALVKLSDKYGENNAQVARWLPNLNAADEAIRRQSNVIDQTSASGTKFNETISRTAVMNAELAGKIKYTSDGFESLRSNSGAAEKTVSLYQNAVAGAALRTSAYGQAVYDLGEKYGQSNAAVARWLPNLNAADTAIRKQADSMEGASGKASKFYDTANRVAIMNAELGGKIKYTSDGFKSLTKEIDESTKSSSSFATMLPHVALVTASYMAMRAALGGLASMFGEVGKFDLEMARVGAATGAYGAELEKMGLAARNAAKDSIYMASEAATAMKELVFAGLSAKDAMVALPEVIKLATIEQMELGKATEYAVNIMNAFNLSATDLSHVNDVLASTSAKTSTNLKQLGEAMKYAAPAGSQLGYSIEQVSAMLGIMAQQGIKGGQAGRVLQQAFVKTGEAAKYLGMDAGATLIDVLKVMEERQLGVATATKLFGLVALKGVLALKDNISAYEGMNMALLNSDGAMNSMVSHINEGLIPQLQKLKATSADISIAIYNNFKDQIIEKVVDLRTNLAGAEASIVKFSTIFLKAMGEIIPIIVDFGVKFAIAFGFLTAMGAVMAFSKSLKALGSVVVALTSQIELMNIATKANVIIAGSLAVGAFATWLKEQISDSKQATIQMDQLKEKTENLLKLADGDHAFNLFKAGIIDDNKISNSIEQLKDYKKTLEELNKANQTKIDESPFPWATFIKGAKEEIRSTTGEINIVTTAINNLSKTLAGLRNQSKDTTSRAAVLALEQSQMAQNELDAKYGYSTDNAYLNEIERIKKLTQTIRESTAFLQIYNDKLGRGGPEAAEDYLHKTIIESTKNTKTAAKEAAKLEESWDKMSAKLQTQINSEGMDALSSKIVAAQGKMKALIDEYGRLPGGVAQITTAMAAVMDKIIESPLKKMEQEETDYGATAYEASVNKIIKAADLKLTELTSIEEASRLLEDGGVKYTERIANLRIAIETNKNAELLLMEQAHQADVAKLQTEYIATIEGTYGTAYDAASKKVLEYQAIIVAAEMKSAGLIFDKEAWLTAKHAETLAVREQNVLDYYAKTGVYAANANEIIVRNAQDAYDKAMLATGSEKVAAKASSDYIIEENLKKAESSDSFFEGVTAKGKDLVKSAETWGKQGIKFAEDFAKAGESAISNGLFDVIKGDMDGFQKAWVGFCDSLLRSFTDIIAKMAAQEFRDAVFGTGSSASGGGSTGSTIVSGLGTALSAVSTWGGDAIDWIGSFFAEGGQYPTDRPFVVGERGYEVVDPRNRSVLNHEDSKAFMSARGLQIPGFASGTGGFASATSSDIPEFFNAIESATDALGGLADATYDVTNGFGGNGGTTSSGAITGGQTISQEAQSTAASISNLGTSTDKTSESMSDVGRALKGTVAAYGTYSSVVGFATSVMTGNVLGMVAFGLKLGYSVAELGEAVFGIAELEAELGAFAEALGESSVAADRATAVALGTIAGFHMSEDNMASIAAFNAEVAASTAAALSGLADSADAASDAIGPLGGRGDTTGYGGDTGGSADRGGPGGPGSRGPGDNGADTGNGPGGPGSRGPGDNGADTSSSSASLRFLGDSAKVVTEVFQQMIDVWQTNAASVGGSYATGGQYDPSRMFWAGERGAELIDPRTRTVLSHEQSLKYASWNGIQIPGYEDGTLPKGPGTGSSTLPDLSGFGGTTMTQEEYDDQVSSNNRLSSSYETLAEWQKDYNAQLNEYLGVSDDLGKTLADINKYYEEQAVIAFELGATAEDVDKLEIDRMAVRQKAVDDWAQSEADYYNEKMGLENELGATLAEISAHYEETIRSAEAAGMSEEELAALREYAAEVATHANDEYWQGVADYYNDVMDITSGLESSINDVREKFAEYTAAAIAAGASVEQLTALQQAQTNVIMHLYEEWVRNLVDPMLSLITALYSWKRAIEGVTTAQIALEQLAGAGLINRGRVYSGDTTLSGIKAEIGGMRTTQEIEEYMKAISDYFSTITNALTATYETLSNLKESIDSTIKDIQIGGMSDVEQSAYYANLIAAERTKLLSGKQTNEERTETIQSLYDSSKEYYELQKNIIKDRYQTEIDLINKKHDDEISSIEAIRDKIKSLTYSAFNLALPKAKVEAAQEDYAKLFAAAQTGDASAVSKYLGFIDTYLQSGQDAYKSSQAYLDMYAQVMKDLGSIDSGKSTAELSLEKETEIAAATAAMEAELKLLDANMIAALKELGPSITDTMTSVMDELIAVMDTLAKLVGLGYGIGAGTGTGSSTGESMGMTLKELQAGMATELSSFSTDEYLTLAELTVIASAANITGNAAIVAAVDAVGVTLTAMSGFLSDIKKFLSYQGFGMAEIFTAQSVLDNDFYKNIIEGTFAEGLYTWAEGELESLGKIIYNTGKLNDYIGVASSYKDGGITNVDGPAMLHANEAVIPLKGGKVPVQMSGSGGYGDPEVKSLLKTLVVQGAGKQNVTLVLDDGRELKGYIRAEADRLDQDRFEKNVKSRNYR
mgnify:CR=1 FL=1